MRKAAIDIGTNTCRLLIGEENEGNILHLLVKRHITRLGGGFSKDTGLSPEAMARTATALEDFANEIRHNSVSRVRAVATSAVRDAVNGLDFCKRIEDATGIRLEIIEGDEEGMLTLRGALAGLDDRSGDFLVFDIGGGSTEFTFSSGETPLFSKSLPLGVVRLLEGQPDMAAIKDKIGRELMTLRAEAASAVYMNPAATTLVATAGTATTVAAIDLKLETYDYRLVNNHVIDVSRIREIFEMILPLSLEERLRIPGLEKGREDLIVPGLLIMLAAMESLGFDRLKVNDFGLLEGVFLSA